MANGASYRDFSELATATHDGKVVVVASGNDGVLRYTIRQSGFEDSAVSPVPADAPPGFEEWKPVPLDRSSDDPSVVAFEQRNLVESSKRPILRSVYGKRAAQSSPGRVTLLSGLGHLYLFRVSSRTNRLLMSRFVLDGMTNELVPKLEVRYRRSGHKLSPEGGFAGTGAVTLDTLAFRDTAHNPFFEPAKELTFLGDFDPEKPWFSVELMPTGEHEKHRWHFFVFTNGRLRLISVAASADGLVEPRDQRKVRVDPDNVDRKVTTTVLGIVDRTIELPGPVVDGFDSTTYHNQVARATKAGEQLLKDSTRVMLAVPVQRATDDQPSVAALSFTVGQLGLLAQIDRASEDELLVGKTKEVLLPLTDLEEIKLIADRSPPPRGRVIAMGESQKGDIVITSDGDFAQGAAPQAGTDVEVWGTRSFDGTYVARNVDEQAGTFELDTTFDDGPASDDQPTQGNWEVADDESGLTFENMIVGYERIGESALKVICTSHNLRDGDEIRIAGTTDHDGTFQISNVDAEENSFVIDKAWPAGEVVNFSIRNRRGLVFDGQGDHLRAGPVDVDAHQVDQRLERTISAWVSIDAISGQPQTIFDCASELMHVFVDPDGHLSASAKFADGHAAMVVEPEPLPVGRWVHVTASIDYEGEGTGRTTLQLLRAGEVTATEVVEPRKPVHLPMRNLHLSGGAALPMSTVRYDIDETKSLTIEAWVLPLGAGREVVASWCQQGTFELGLVDGAGGRHVEWVTNGVPLTGTVLIDEPRWYHLAATFTPTSGRQTIVIDGVLDAEATVEATAGPFLSINDAEALGRRFVSGALGAPMTTVHAQGNEVALLMSDDGSGHGWKQTGDREWIEINDAGSQVGEPYIERLRDNSTLLLHRDEDDVRVHWEHDGWATVTRSRSVTTTVAWADEDLSERPVADIVSFEWHIAHGSESTTVDRFVRVSERFWERYGADGRVEAYEEYHRAGQSIWLNFSHLVDPLGEPSALWSSWAQVDFARNVFMLRDEDHGTLHEVTYGTPDAVTIDSLHRVRASDNRVLELEDPGRRLWVERADGAFVRRLVETSTRAPAVSAAASAAANATARSPRSWFDRLADDIVGVADGVRDGVLGLFGDSSDGQGDNAIPESRVELRSVDDDARVVIDIEAREWTTHATVFDAPQPITANDLNRAPATYDRYRGAVADVRVWSRVRTPAAIKTDMARQLDGSEAGLVAFWPLGETSAGQSSDLTKNKIHLDLVPLELPVAIKTYTRDLTPVVAELQGDPLAGSAAEASVDRALERLWDPNGAEAGRPPGVLFVTPDDYDDNQLIESLALRIRSREEGRHRFLRIDAEALRNDASELELHERFQQVLSDASELRDSTLVVSEFGQWWPYWSTDNLESTAMGELAVVATITQSDWNTLSEHPDFEFMIDVMDPIEIRDDEIAPEPLDQTQSKASISTAPVETGPWYTTPHRAPGRVEDYAGFGFQETYWIAARTTVETADAADTGAATGEDQVEDAVTEQGEAQAEVAAQMVVVDEFKGKLSEVEIWTVNPAPSEIREQRHLQLQGNEYGLAHNWRCGGIIADPASGSELRLTPDMGPDAVDAIVIGDVFVSARDLVRRDSAGLAVRYSNDDLVAVTQGAQYRETFEFRARSTVGEPWGLGDLDNVNGTGRRVFSFRLWGKKSKTSDDRVEFDPDEGGEADFEEVDGDDGWYRASVRFTVPNDVNLIRCFDIDEVRGLNQGDETGDDWSEDDWAALSIRRHRIELVSDAITRASYRDDLTHLSFLNDNGETLRQAKADLPVFERRRARLQADLADIAERLKWFELRDQLAARQRIVDGDLQRLGRQLRDARRSIVDFEEDSFNYYVRLKSSGSGKWLTVTGDSIRVDGDLSSQAALFELEAAGEQRHRLRLAKGGQVVAVRDRVEKVEHSREERFLGFLWKTETVRWTTDKKIENEVFLAGASDGDVWKLHSDGGDRYRIENIVHEVSLADMGPLARFFSVFGIEGVRAIQEQGLPGQRWDLERLDAMPEWAESELRRLRNRATSLIERQRKKRALSRWIDEVLRLGEDKSQAAVLRSRQSELTKRLNSAKSSILAIHDSYSDLAATSSATTMELVAEDQNGLTTYGSLLGFASPATALSATAVAEGNVQLGYFDTDGRMRLTNYDATSDSVNASYEEWLGSRPARCAELHHERSRLELIDKDGKPKPIELPESGHTVEAWFLYPPPVVPAEAGPSAAVGQPYPLSFLTSNADGNESAIAIASGRRLGTVVDGFFHDAGVDLETYLDPGWHHVAARTEAGTTSFFLDGEAIGADHGSRAAMHTRRINSANRGLQVEGRDLGLKDSDVTVQFWVRLGAETRRMQFVDIGSRASVEMVRASGDEWFLLTVAARVIERKQIVHDVKNWLHVAVAISNRMAVFYLNGVEVRRDTIHPGDFANGRLRLGSGGSVSSIQQIDVADLKVWRRALSSDEVSEQMYEAPSLDDESLAGHWPMATVEDDGQTMVRNMVAPAESDAPKGHLRIEGGPATPSRPLPRVVSGAVTELGNAAGGGAPAGSVGHYRFWTQPLPAEEIRAQALVASTGNEPDLLCCFPLDDFDEEGQARSMTGDWRVRMHQGRVVPSSAALGHPGIRVADFEGDTSMLLDDVELTGSFTVEFWLRRPNDRLQVIVDHREGDARWSVGSLHGRLWFALHGQTPVWFDGEQASERWTHIAGVYNAETAQASLFVDGEHVQSVAATPPNGALSGVLELCPRGDNLLEVQAFQMASFRLWNEARSEDQLLASHDRASVGAHSALVVDLPLDELFGLDEIVNQVDGKSLRLRDPDRPPRSVRVADLPVVPATGIVTAEYNTVGPNPVAPDARRAMLRRFYGFVGDSGVSLIVGKRIEELVLKWIGNAQFEPTLLGYIEGPPPVPSENLTIDTDYDGATTVELVMTDEVEYTWNRSTDIGGGLDINAFLGVGWGVEGGIGISTKLSEGHFGARGSARTEWRRNADSRISARSTTTSRDELELRGSFEQEPKFEHLGSRYVPKNVGYALVVSGMADVFVTQMKRSGRMVGYEVQPAEDMPPDVNTITFLINPAYTLNGSLDGLVGSHAADDRFYRHVPEMRAQHGSRYPASYYNLKQAYDLKRSIERWDKERESYFAAFESEKVMGLGDGLLDQIPAAGDDAGADLSAFTEDQSSSPRGGEEDTRSDDDRADEDKEKLRKKFEDKREEQEEKVKQRTDDIERRFADKDKQQEASAAFKAWQRKMEGLQLRAAKRNIQNTYVWDADGGIHYEEEDFANTIEHTIGGSFSLDASLGADLNAQISWGKVELQAMATLSMSQTMSKSRQSTKSFELNVRLDRVERRGVTGADDMPIHPGEKVDRYRFMSFYLEGDTDHFTDFFNYVVDPEWLMSNDEEARALRQVAGGKPNKTWRVLHRVTYVERPALMGFGRDVRVADDLEQAAETVYSAFDNIERDNAQLRAQVASMNAELQKITAALTGGAAPGGAPVGQPGLPAQPGQPAPVGGSPSGGQQPGDLSGGGPADRPIDLRDQDDPIDVREPGLDVLNRADQAWLEGLVGIGPSLASDIINRRRARGSFASIDELTEIAGIGTVLADKLRPQLEAEDG